MCLFLQKKKKNSKKKKIKSETQTRPVMEMFFKMDYYLPIEVSNSLRQFYFYLLGDARYKRNFACSFANCYPYFLDFMRQPAKSGYHELLGNLGVQFFTVATIAPVLVKQGNIMHILCREALDLLQQIFTIPSTEQEKKLMNSLNDKKKGIGHV